MLNEEENQKLTAYFGFCNRKKALAVGMMLEEKLERRKVKLLLINNTCSDKNYENLVFYKTKNPQMTVIRLKEDIQLPLLVGYETLNAVGVTDLGLAKAIINVLEKHQ